MLVKLTSGVNFTNILLTQLHQFPCAKKSSNLKCKYKNLRAKLSYEKAARKMLVKLTPVHLFSFALLETTQTFTKTNFLSLAKPFLSSS
jgi:hypothetical protein